MILERNGNNANVADNEKGYKDTVYPAPGDSVKLIVKITDYKDAYTPYRFLSNRPYLRYAFWICTVLGFMGKFIKIDFLM